MHRYEDSQPAAIRRLSVEDLSVQTEFLMSHVQATIRKMPPYFFTRELPVKQGQHWTACFLPAQKSELDLNDAEAADCCFAI